MYVAAGFTVNPKLEETVTLSFSQQYSFTSVGYLLANAPSRAAHSCRKNASYTHTEAICWWTCTTCCTHAVEKLGPKFSKLHSWTEYYITIRIRQFPSQQALQKSYESQRTQPCQLSQSYAFSFEKVMCYLIFSYLSEAPVPGVLTSGFSFKLASLAWTWVLGKIQNWQK